MKMTYKFYWICLLNWISFTSFSQNHNEVLQTTTIGVNDVENLEAVISITSPNGVAYEVEGEANFTAGKEIILEPGYHAKTGSKVCLKIATVPITYVELKREPSSSIEPLYDNTYLNFTFDQRYTPSTTEVLDYELFDSDRKTYNLGTFPIDLGDNRFILDATTLAIGTYTLVVTANKNKKYYIQFEKGI